MTDKKTTNHGSYSDEISRFTVICVFISFAGWCLEKLGRYMIFGDSSDRGFLTLPLCPIYGVSVVLIYLLCGTPIKLRGMIGHPIRRTKLWQRAVGGKAWRKYVFYFLFVTAVSTLSELVVGLTAKAFGVTLWDYSDRALDLWGVICPSFSLTWGILITAFMAFLWDPIYGIAHKIPKRTVRQMAFTLSLAIAIDFTVSLFLT